MFQKTRNRLKQIDFEKAMMTAVSRFTDDVAEMNRAQLWAGKDSSNARMSPLYALSTKKLKARKGQPTNRVTLKDSGMFHASITAEAARDALVIGSKHVVKGFDLAGFLNTIYGEKAPIYGLAPVNRRKLLKQSRPEFVKEVKREFA
jgi:phage gpG-like protein